ncbi:MAG: tRNA (adenosine(37)-N6)-threonylcarbamoyltransferase complex dimerization subunit type 1 TsaB [Alphaproteobacteria bacterium CG11_big_fil_rev_8_21_14_0_20_44_7]|nr:MAG: tRNA (adenosine(37)-N6)-threonylcarbamoyltransferase complex dimerization subunit type 1 TsaB [Alphaproteobacteria bacterium CG11_big_fil_rev_8_21_14_0_20_44_7]
MKLLAIDTSSQNFSIAIYDSAQQIAYFENDEASKQAEQLIPQIEILLEKKALKYQDLDYIAVNVGPGSFTGLRIGIAAAKGFALALPHLKTIAVTALEATAFAKDGGQIFLDARRGQAYTQEFDANSRPLSEPRLVDYEGDFDEFPNADLIAQLALQKIGKSDIKSELSPLYIRKPDAKLPKNSATNG